MRKSIIIFILSLFINITLFSFGPCEVIEKFDKGSINWEKGVVTAVGWGFPKKGIPPEQARLLAKRAARCDAYRNLIEIINGVRINSETTIKDSTVEDDVIKTKVNGFVRRAEISEPKYMSDGTIQVIVTVPLSGVGGLNEIYFPKPSAEEKTIKTYEAVEEIPKTDFSKPYTGLIVDARGIKLRPAMSPKILDEKKGEVYGSAFVDQKFAVKFGMVGYAKDIEEATKIDRVKGNPLIVKALNSSGKQKTDVIISNVNAALLCELNKHLTFLKECKVVFVLD